MRAALEEIGYASYIYDLMPEQIESCLGTLDAMMANWNALGLSTGYPSVNDPAYIQWSTKTNVPDAANLAIIQNLAIKIAPRFGKTVPQELKQSAKECYDALLVQLVTPRNMNLRKDLPVGAGNKPWLRVNQSVFIRPPDQTIDNNDSGEIELS